MAKDFGIFGWPRSRFLRRLPVVFLAVLVGVTPIATMLTVMWSEDAAYVRLSAQSHDRLALYGVTLDAELDKYRNVPLVLASDPEVIELLRVRSPERIDALNQRLTSINRKLGASAVYLIDGDGWVIASSNWQLGSRSFIGQHLDFRPYFVTARQGQMGRYFGIGSTAGDPGYYIAMPVRHGETVVGAVAVKMEMADVERGWAGGGERAFVTDPHGIVIITNTPSWRFNSLEPLSRDEAGIIRDSRQYGDRAIPSLDLQRGERLVTIGGGSYVMASRLLSDGNTLHVLVGVAEARAHARDLGFLAAAVLGLTVTGFYSVIQRTRMRRRYTRELEDRVDQRTAALQAEVAERRRAEEELKAKQDELVQAAKLAALGQMSAGITHEINQPLAAIRSYADNGVKLLDLARLDDVRSNLAEIAGLTNRLARITGQLKQFARKASGRAEPVSIQRAVADSLALMTGRFREAGVSPEWEPPPEDLWVCAEDVRLQQVLINLFRNALDAMRSVDERRLEIGIGTAGDAILLTVRDTGAGIPEEALPQLFDPFFTTKPAGEGLGLGLSISGGIIRAMGGQLTAANHPQGGAIFTVLLKRMETT